MQIVYTEKFTDLARVLSAYQGFPVAGRNIPFDQIDKNMRLARDEAEKTGYIMAPFSIDTTDKNNEKTFWIWGEDLVSKKYEIKEDIVQTVFVPKDDIQLQAIAKLTSRPEFSKMIYLNTAGGDSSYICNLMEYCHVSDRALWIVDINELTPEAVKSSIKNTSKTQKAKTRMQQASLSENLLLLADTKIYNACNAVYPGIEYPGAIGLPVLNRVYDATKRILSKDLSPSYQIKVQGTAYGTDFLLAAKGLSCASQVDADQKIETLPKTAIVTKATQKIWPEYPKGAFTKGTILDKAKKKLGFSYDRTEAALTRLFEGGFITNPNTNSCRLPKNSKEELFQQLMTLKDTATFSDMLSQARPYYAYDQIFSDNDEHGIVITSKRPAIKNKDEIEIYQLIFIELIKVYYPVREISTIHIEALAGDMKLTGTGRVLVKEGFSALEERRPPKTNAPMQLKEGDVLSLTYSVTYKKPSLPPYPGLFEIEKDLPLSVDQVRSALSQMEGSGLINKIGDKYTITPLATPIMRILQDAAPLLNGTFLNLIKSCVENCKSISSDKMETVTGSLMKTISDTTDIWIKDIAKKKADGTNLICPVCGKPLFKDQEHIFCNYCGFTMNRFFAGKELNDRELTYLYENRKTPLVDVFLGDYMARLIIGDDNTVYLSSDSDFLCPVCGKPLKVQKKTKEYCCTNLQCGFILPNEYLGYILTKDDKRELLTHRQSYIIRLTINGTPVSATMILDRTHNYRISHILQEKE